MRKSLISSVFLCIAMLSQSVASAGVMFPTDPALSQQFGDFKVYSLPFLQNYFSKPVNANPIFFPSQYNVQSSPGQIANSIIIGTGPAGAVNNQDLGLANVDNAEETPNNGAGSFTNYLDLIDPSPTITGDNGNSWDISVASLTTFLNNTNSNLNFFFNLNERGSQEGLDGIDMLGWAEISLTGSAGTVSYYLGGRNGAGTPTGPYNVAPTIGNASDPSWAYIHGYINVNSTTGAFVNFGRSNVPGTENLGQNLGANQAAFAFTSQALQTALYSGQYDMLRVRFAMDRIDNGYEQLFIFPTGDRIGVVPEPMSLVIWSGFGIAAFAGRRFRRVPKA